MAFVGGTVVFFLLRRFAVVGGDTHAILSGEWRYLWSGRLVYYIREPLAHLSIRFCELLGCNLRLSFEIVASLAGGCYLAFLTLFSRHWGFLAVNVLSIITLNFVGHVEFYGPVAAALVLYFYILWRAIEDPPRASLGWVVAAFGLACLCHKLTMIYSPTLLWLLINRTNTGWTWRRWSRRQWEWALACVIGLIMLDLALPFLQLMGVDRILIVTRDEPMRELITPLTWGMAEAIAKQSPTGAFFLFSIGQALHWKMFLFFLVSSSPLGIPCVVAFRKRMRGLPALALASAACLGIVWMFLWHPHVGWKDWDLFSMGMIPFNLLAGGLWAGLFHASPLRATDRLKQEHESKGMPETCA